MAMILVAAGCGDEKLAPVYVGKVTEAGSDAVVAAVTDGSEVAFYLCGGATTYASLSRWFKGEVDERGAFSIKSAGFVVSGDLAAGTGTVKTPEGGTLAWSLRPTEDPTEGLYHAVDEGCRSGAVAADFDGDGVVDLQGTWCGGADRFAQVTPIRPLLATDQGIAVQVQTSPAKGLFVSRVRSP